MIDRLCSQAALAATISKLLPFVGGRTTALLHLKTGDPDLCPATKETATRVTVRVVRPRNTVVFSQNEFHENSSVIFWKDCHDHRLQTVFRSSAFRPAVNWVAFGTTLTDVPIAVKHRRPQCHVYDWTIRGRCSLEVIPESDDVFLFSTTGHLVWRWLGYGGSFDTTAI